MARAAIRDVDALRRYLSQTAPFLSARAHHETGLRALDRLLAPCSSASAPAHTQKSGHPPSSEASGGLPKGALTLLGGPPGSGRTSIAARVLAQETAAGRPVAWIDVRQTLYPPALEQAGLSLERLLMIRSTPERAIYAAEQILASGAFRVVAMSGLERHLRPSQARRLQTAAEATDAIALVLVDPTLAPKITVAALELSLTRRGRGVMVTVERDRMGPSGRRAFVALPVPPGHRPSQSPQLTPPNPPGGGPPLRAPPIAA